MNIHWWRDCSKRVPGVQVFSSAALENLLINSFHNRTSYEKIRITTGAHTLLLSYCTVKLKNRALPNHVSSVISRPKHLYWLSQVPPGLEGLFLDWLTALECELGERIRAGCDRFPNWRAAMQGSVKTLRRLDEVLSITMHLQRNKTSLATL